MVSMRRKIDLGRVDVRANILYSKLLYMLNLKINNTMKQLHGKGYKNYKSQNKYVIS